MSLMCGGGGGGDELTPAERAAHKAIAKACQENADREAKIIKMLLLGAGESGKSTIFKQMKIINKDGYTDKEKKDFISIVHSNVITAIKVMFQAFGKLQEEMPYEVSQIMEKCEADGGYHSEQLTAPLAELIKKAWDTDPIKAVFSRRREFQLNDSAEYFFNVVTRLGEPGYVPTTDDILRSRVRTTGIVQSDFMIKSLNFSMFDVGGQRNERRKWIHCFDNVNAVVFVASLSEFDQMLFEDETKNRLDEALDLFGQIINSKWFKNTSVILFLNKKDLFEFKLQGKSFADYINRNTAHTYDGPNEMKLCAEFIRGLFLALNKNAEKTVFTHITTAVDTSNVKFVFNAVVAMILEENLKASGLA